MTAAVVLSFAAAAAGVLGAWEALAAAERLRVAAAVGRAVEPLARAGKEGRAPTGPERRRLALVATGVLVVAGWLVGGLGAGVLAAVGGPLVVTRARAVAAAPLCP